MRSVARLREVRDRLLATHELFPVAIGTREGEALRERIRGEQARRTLEVGLGWGVATLFICEGLIDNGTDVGHVACDPYQFASPKFEGAGVRALEDAGVADLVEFHEEESQTLLPRLLAEDRRFDLAFVDGSHLFERVKPDLVHCDRLVKAGGIVFVDDVQLTSVRRAVDDCLEHLGWQVEEADHEGASHHWLIARTRPDPCDAGPA